jgi:hypothetical protein
MHPAPYQPVSNPYDSLKLETGYYIRPLHQRDGKYWIIPQAATEVTDKFLVTYKCYYPISSCGSLVQLALYRSAELALEKDYGFFAVLEQTENKECKTGRLRREPGSSFLDCGGWLYHVAIVVRLLREPLSEISSAKVYNAKALMDSLPLEVPTLPRSG